MQTGLELQNKFIFTAQMGMGKKSCRKPPIPHFHFSLGKKKFFSAQREIFLSGFINALATKEKQSTDFTKPIDCSVCYPLTIYKTKLNNFNI